MSRQLWLPACIGGIHWCMIHTLSDSLVQLTCFCKRKSQKKLLQSISCFCVYVEGGREKQERRDFDCHYNQNGMLVLEEKGILGS